jgi:hypothetical protein
MADEVIVEEQQVVAPALDPFKEESWQETVIAPDAAQQAAPAPATVVAPIDPPAPAIDYNVWVKENLGFENVEVAKQEIEKVKNFKPVEPEPLKFQNEASERLFNALKDGKDDEVYAILRTKKELSELDKIDSKEAIKLHLKHTNKTFTPEDVQDVFEERYTIPATPKQDVDELEEDYNARVAEYDEQLGKVNRKIERDARIAKEELAKLNQEIVLPQINREPTPATTQPTQEELETAKKWREAVTQQLETEYKNFNGFNVTYKDKEVELPIAFTATDQEKLGLKNEVSEILQSNDANGFFGKRWFDEEGKPKINVMMEDLHLLQNKEVIFQKLVNDSANKRLEHHLQVQSNIQVNGGQQRTPEIDNIQKQRDELVKAIMSA